MLTQMDTRQDTQYTIAEYAARHGISPNTVRRRIKAGTLNAEKVDGKYLIPATDGEGNQESNRPVNRIDQSPLVDQLQSEIAHLRDQLSTKDSQLSNRDNQINQLNQLLAMTSAQNGELTKQLPAPRQSLLHQLRSAIARLTGNNQAHG